MRQTPPLTLWLIVGILAWLVPGCHPHLHIGGKYYMGPGAEQKEAGEPDDLERDERWDSLEP